MSNLWVVVMDAPRHRLDISKIVLRLATLNVRGISSETKKRGLIEDAKNYKCDIISIQETKTTETDRTIEGFRLLTFKPECKHYGLGFVLSPRISHHLTETWTVSDRIAVLRLATTDTNTGRRFITIINVYGPTSPLSKEKPEEREQFYRELQNTVNKQKGDTIILTGDFNSKVGQKLDNIETCLGSFSKGNRNENGEELLKFCIENNYFITNSAFKHKSAHITTWVGQYTNKTTNTSYPIYNQIDYIIVPNWIRHNLRDSRTYSGILTNTDHKILITTLSLNIKFKKRPVTSLQGSQRFDTTKLSNRATQYNYQIECLENYTFNQADTSPNEILRNLQSSFIKAAENTLPKIEKDQHKHHCPKIAALSKQQKNLRLQITLCTDAEKRALLKKERNKISHEIRDQALTNANDRIDKIVDEIEKCGESTKMFKAVKALTHSKTNKVVIHNKNGHTVHDDKNKLQILSQHFKEKYQGDYTIDPFSANPGLAQPITTNEVNTAIKKLNNNRAPGLDNIQAELIKNAPSLLIEEIKKMFNMTFEKGQKLDIGNGNLILLPKPGKPPGPVSHLRPIVLLPVLRKVLSLITLDRIKDKINNYLSPSQAGFRACRSTADIVWTHRWLTGRIDKYKEQYTILGIDMSSAFDTINRAKLINVLETFLDEDEVKLTRILLADTCLTIRSGHNTTTVPTIIGTPQGDSLSPVLFIVYLEAALRELRPKLQTTSVISPSELIYADDVDFIFNNEEEAKSQINIISASLKTWNLQVNENKTEITTINRQTSTWKTTKKLGSLLDTKEDIKRRKILATAAFKNMYKLWIRRHKLTEKRILMLYNTLVLPILLYNSGTWGVNQTELNGLDSFHRHQLRKLLGIKWEDKVSNKQLYTRCQCGPISKNIIAARRRLLGHILRLDLNTPAQVAMQEYFRPGGPKYRGRPPSNLPNTIDKDLASITILQPPTDHTYATPTNALKCTKQLESLRFLAQDRDNWRSVTAVADDWQAN